MKKKEIVQYKDDEFRNIEDLVADERILHLDINSEVSFDVIFTPENIKDFVYGNLFTEGFISTIDEVKNYQEDQKPTLINVSVSLKNFARQKKYLKKNYNIVWTECGSAPEIKRLTDQIKPIENEITIKAKDILKILDHVKIKNELFKQTGAYHYAFLFDNEFNLEYYSYDIGRHNAVDKVVGAQLQKDGIFQNKLMFVTGRISSDLVLKCLRARIPFILSRSAPLENAIELANKYNLCLIGFLRGKRFNIYSNSQAIEL
jgi:FdhD protein